MSDVRRCLLWSAAVFVLLSWASVGGDRGRIRTVAVADAFVAHFTDASIGEIVWVSDQIPELMVDQDLYEANLFLGSDENDDELRFLYESLSQFEARVAVHRGEHDSTDAENHEDATLHAFTFVVEFLAVADSLETADLRHNTWLVFLENSDAEEALEAAVANKLDLRSLFFVFKDGTVEDWYRIASDTPVTKQTFGVFGEGSGFRLTAEQFIWDRRSDLRGYPFRIAYIDNEPFVYEVNGTFHGVTYDLAATLQQTLNFSMENMVRDTIYGDLLPNGTWLGVVGLLDRKEADLSINDFSITETRSRVIDFATGIFKQYGQLFMHLPKQAAAWDTFVDAFNSTFWILLVVVALASAVLFHFVFKRSNLQDKNRPLEKSCASVLLTFGALSVPETAVRMSTRSLLFSVCMFGAMIYWIYNSILVSLLTVDIIVLPINSLQELASKQNYKVILKDGDAYTQFFTQSSNAINPDAKSIYDNSIKNNPAAFVKSQTVAGDMLLRDSSLVFFGEADGTKLNMAGYPCRIRAAPPQLYENYVTFAFQKDSPYVPLFNTKILAMKQAGEVGKVTDRYLKAKELVTCSQSSFTTIGYQNIFSAFVVLAAGAAAAALLALAEAARAKMARKTDTEETRSLR